MTTKAKTDLAEPASATQTPDRTLELAHQVHTLARLMASQIAVTHPWIGPAPMGLPWGQLPLAYPPPPSRATAHSWAVPAVWPCFP